MFYVLNKPSLRIWKFASKCVVFNRRGVVVIVEYPLLFAKTVAESKHKLDTVYRPCMFVVAIGLHGRYERYTLTSSRVKLVWSVTMPMIVEEEHSHTSQSELRVPPLGHIRLQSINKTIDDKKLHLKSVMWIF